MESTLRGERASMLPGGGADAVTATDAASTVAHAARMKDEEESATISVPPTFTRADEHRRDALRARLGLGERAAAVPALAPPPQPPLIRQQAAHSKNVSNSLHHHHYSTGGGGNHSRVPSQQHHGANALPTTSASASAPHRPAFSHSRTGSGVGGASGLMLAAGSPSPRLPSTGAANTNGAAIIVSPPLYCLATSTVVTSRRGTPTLPSANSMQPNVAFLGGGGSPERGGATMTSHQNHGVVNIIPSPPPDQSYSPLPPSSSSCVVGAKAVGAGEEDCEEALSLAEEEELALLDARYEAFIAEGLRRMQQQAAMVGRGGGGMGRGGNANSLGARVGGFVGALRQRGSAMVGSLVGRALSSRRAATAEAAPSQALPSSTVTSPMLAGGPSLLGNSRRISFPEILSSPASFLFARGGRGGGGAPLVPFYVLLLASFVLCCVCVGEATNVSMAVTGGHGGPASHPVAEEGEEDAEGGGSAAPFTTTATDLRGQRLAHKVVGGAAITASNPQIVTAHAVYSVASFMGCWAFHMLVGRVAASGPFSPLTSAAVGGGGITGGGGSGGGSRGIMAKAYVPFHTALAIAGLGMAWHFGYMYNSSSGPGGESAATEAPSGDGAALPHRQPPIDVVAVGSGLLLLMCSLDVVIGACAVALAWARSSSSAVYVPSHSLTAVGGDNHNSHHHRRSSDGLHTPLMMGSTSSQA